MELDHKRTKMLNLHQSFIITSCIRAVVTLKVPDILSSHGPLSSRQIAARLPLSHQDLELRASHELDRIMHLLAFEGVFDERVLDGERIYSLNGLSKFLDGGNDDSVGASLMLFSSIKHIEAFDRIPEAILKGSSGNSNFFETGDPEKVKEFNEGLSKHTKGSMRMVVDVYRGFEDAQVLVDVGGGLGASLSVISARYPHLKCINFDLPHVVSQSGFLPGIEHVGGDMFDSIPSGDTILLKWIIHDWDDERAVKILTNCYKSLADGGKVVIIEAVYPDDVNEKSVESECILMFDITMLATMPGGKERTLPQLEKLAKAAGFNKLCPVAKAEVFTVMELYKQ